MHGQSQDFAPPHTVHSCADDLIEQLDVRPDVVVGHSFGGKVALQYLAVREQLGIPLKYVVTVDTNPGLRDGSAESSRGSDAIFAIISALESLPKPLQSREQFAKHLSAHGIGESLIAWLMMNVRPVTGTQQLELRLQLPAIRELLADYFAVDAWSAVESSTTPLTLVIGGMSPSYGPAARERALRAARTQPDRVITEVYPDSGHWVHVDAPAALGRTVEFALKKAESAEMP